MKNLSVFMLTLAAAVAVVCCQKEVDYADDCCEAAGRGFTATIESLSPDTRTSLSDGYAIWSSGDTIAVFQGNSDADKFVLKDIEAGSFRREGESASAESVLFDANVAVYPYSSLLECSEDDGRYAISDVDFPSSQTYTAGSFAEESFVMVAVSSSLDDRSLDFRNVSGGLRLWVKGDAGIVVKSVELSGNADELISGKATVTAFPDQDPTVTTSLSSYKSVTLDCGGVALSPDNSVELIIALVPTVFESGFEVKFNTTIDGRDTTYVRNTLKKQKVNRSRILTMPAVELSLSESEPEPEPQEGDYVDEYGINHGQGIKIGETVWAPVNCGYHETDYAYGKLYQWGRKYGQGYDGNLYDVNGSRVGTYSDATVPTIESGPVDLSSGQFKDNGNIFYKNSSSPYDWLSPQDGKLWNSGTEEAPVKTEYDPCPEGWRVPTYTELNELCSNRSSWTTDENGQVGYWFSGASAYTSEVPQVFFPAAGSRDSSGGNAGNRGLDGYYWSSGPYYSYAYYLSFGSDYTGIGSYYNRAYGYSVRCVQDDGELIPVASVTLDRSSLVMEVEQTYPLSATITPSNANHQSAHWWSDDESVAVVDQSGKVTAVSAGTATITAMAGMQVATCSVTVNEPEPEPEPEPGPVPVSGVSLDHTALELYEGESVTLVATVSPDNADDKSVKWSSSDTAVATVNNGVVKAVSAGLVIITAQTTVGGYKAECKVTVKARFSDDEDGEHLEDDGDNDW